MMTDGDSLEAGPWLAVNLAIEHATVGADLFDVVAASSVIQGDTEWSEDDAGMDLTRGALRRAISEARRRIVKDLDWPLAPRAIPGCLGLQWILGPGGYQSTVNVVVPAGEWRWIPARQIRTLNLGGTIKVEEDGGRFRLTVPDVEGVKWIGIGSVQAQLLQPKEGSREQQLVGADPRDLVAALNAEATQEDDGMLRADAALARELNAAGFPEAKDFRAARRNALSEFKEGKRDAARLWAYWLPVTTDDGAPGNDPARDLLARALWPAVRERRIKHRPALTRAVATDTLLPAMSRQLVIPSTDDGVVRDGRGRPLGAFDVAAVDSELIRTGLQALGSVAGHRTINTMVHAVHRQHEAGGADWRTVEFEGGWAGLRDGIGMPNATNSELRAILEAGQWVHWKGRYIEHGGLWTWTAIRGSRAGRGLVRVTAGDMLSPGLAADMRQSGKTSKAARRARKLLPELRHEPPLDAIRRNERGAAWTFARVFVERLVDRADQICTDGGVMLTDDDWQAMARDAGLSAGVVPKLLESWITGTDTSPALIEEISPGRWVLAKDHAPELAFIKAHGDQILGGRKGGRASQKRREAQRAGSVPKRRKK